MEKPTFLVDFLGKNMEKPTFLVDFLGKIVMMDDV